jgi:hypothetical protein
VIKMGRKLRVCWLARLLRGRRLDRNPLRRASDRTETLLLTALVIVFLAAAPVVMLAVGARAHAIAHRTQLDQQAARLQVQALVLQVEPATGGYTQLDPEVRARWTAPSGKVTTGDVIAPFGTVAGATARVWITRDGQPSEPPLLDSQVSGQVAFAEATSVVAVALAVIAGGVVARRALNTRRMAAWDAEWRATGPRWTTRA